MNGSITQSWTKLRSALLGTELPPLALSHKCLSKHRSAQSLGTSFDKSRTRTQSKRTTPVLSRSFTLHNTEAVEGLTDIQVQMIYEAKCKDMALPLMPLQQQRFVEFCVRHLKNRVWDFTDSGVGPRTGKVIAEAVRNNSHFAQLLLGKNDLGDAGALQVVKVLSKALNIVHLDLSSNSLSPESLPDLLTILSAQESIVSLDLSSHEGLHRNRLALPGALALGGLLQCNSLLTAIDVTGTAIGGDGLEAVSAGISGNRSLSYLGLGRNGIKGKAVQSLCSVLGSTRIFHLNLAGNPLGIEGADALASVLCSADRSRVAHLDLSDCLLNFTAAEHIFTSISRSTTLKVLLMSKNPIGDRNNPELAACISDNSVLYHLDLSYCGLRSTGLQAVGQGIGLNHSISLLVLAGNAFGLSQSEAISDLTSGLAKNSALQLLDLSSNHLNDKAITLLCEAVWTHSSLVQFILKDNDIHDRGASLLLELIRFRRKITKLVIENNSISFKIIAKIRDNLAYNVRNLGENRALMLRKEIENYSKSDISEQSISQDFSTAQSQITYEKIQLAAAQQRLAKIKRLEEEKTSIIHTEAVNIHQKHVKITQELNMVWKEIEREQIRGDEILLGLEEKFMKVELEIVSHEKEMNSIKGKYNSARERFAAKLERLNEELSRVKAEKRSKELEVSSVRKQVEVTRVEVESYPKRRKRKAY